MAIVDLDADRVVEGTFAVARKQRLRTRGGAPYLALELVDPSGRSTRACGTTWSCDTRFAEGDGCVSSAGWSASATSSSSTSARSRLPRTRTHPSSHPRSGAIRMSSTDSSSSWRESCTMPGSPRPSRASSRTGRSAPRCARCRRRRTGTTATPAACSSTRSEWRPFAARRRSCFPPAERPPSGRSPPARRGTHRGARARADLQQTPEGRLLGHVHLGLRLIEGAHRSSTARLRRALHAVAVHHDARAARTAEAAVLYHANQLDALAATRPAGATD